MNDRETSLILTALRYFQRHAVGDTPESMLTGSTADRIDELCEKINASHEPERRGTALSHEQLEQLRRYLHDDCQSHLATSGKWQLDKGKLRSALEAVGVSVNQHPNAQPRVIVVVEGGSVQSIFADRPLNADVLDHDDWDDTDRQLDPDQWKRFESMLTEIEQRNLQQQVY